MATSSWWFFNIFGILTFALWVNQIKNEIVQFCGLKDKIAYMTSLWNWLDSIGLTIIFVVTVMTLGMKWSYRNESLSE